MSMTLFRPRRLALATLIACTGTLASVNTASLLASAASPDCISWRISGICYWLFCTPFGCSVKTSVKVTHFIRQAVVSAYLSPGENPWTEMSAASATADGMESALLGGAAGVETGGGRQEMKAPGMRRQNLHFYYGDAYGHPATKIIGGMVPGYSCDSAATPFMPYFASALDALVWRTGVPESLYPEALIPGSREIGSMLSGNMWGNVYPRSGFVTQTDSYKSAAVVVQRVADIITRQGQLHVYGQLTGQRSPGYWPPEPVQENTGTNNHKWQRLSPQLSQRCAVFPDSGGQVRRTVTMPGRSGSHTDAANAAAKHSFTASIFLRLINHDTSKHSAPVLCGACLVHRGISVGTGCRHCALFVRRVGQWYH